MASKQRTFSGSLSTFVVVLGLCSWSRTQGQSTTYEKLSIDRPDVSNLPTTVGPGHFQFELGGELSKSKSTREVYIPNVVFRTGISRKSELRLGFNQLFLDSISVGLSDQVIFVSIGGKYRFVEENGWRPSIAIQPEFNLPFGDGANVHYDHPNYAIADYSLLLLFNNTLHQQVFVNYNAGVFWSQKDRVDYLLSVSGSFLHTHRLGYYLEGYSLIEGDQFPLSFDAGAMYLIYPRLQVDVYFGHRTSGNESSWFYGTGVGFRIDRDDLSPKSFSEIAIQH